MRGRMMDTPLLIAGVLEHAAKYHAHTEIVSRAEEGFIHRYTYAEMAKRSHQLAHALKGLGVQAGERIGTLAWNGYRHLELYFAVPGCGLVCHTINPRLFPEQIRFIIENAKDSYVFLDLSFVRLVEGIADQLSAVKGFVIMTDREHMPATSLPRVHCYEELIAGQPVSFDWPLLDENAASGMCYTSGTTGNPKGVLYSHRSTLLHALSCNQPDVFGLSAKDSVLPVVPMFHVNSWCLPYGAAMVGAKIVFPGAKMDPVSLQELITQEGVTFSAGVPTVWLALLNHLRGKEAPLGVLNRVIVGGAACPEAVFEQFASHGVQVIHAWGMTETSPVGAAGVLTPQQMRLPETEQFRLRQKQGRAPFGVEMRIVDLNGVPLPWDGEARGDLEIRGPWICDGYFNNDDRSSFSADGWFATGDVATITPDGFMEIVDRTKDMIKSGGEWISSIVLENAAISHPAVREAAAIARPDPRWGERPRLVVALKDGASLDPAELKAFFETKVAKWCIPDDILIVDDLPHTATGKLLKMELRRLYGGEVVEGALAL